MSWFAQGKIRSFSWGTDPEASERLVERGQCPAIQLGLNLLTMWFPAAARMLSFCDDNDLSAIINGPLGKGLLIGKFDQTTQFVEGDLRQQMGCTARTDRSAKDASSSKSCTTS